MSKKSILYLLGTIAVMVMIFAFSAQPLSKSSKTSDVITKPVENVIKETSKKTFETKEDEESYLKKLHTAVNKFVRKSAHAFNFALLALFTYLFLSSLGKADIDSVMCTLLFCLLYAASDEIHQRFIDARNGQFPDVCIDLFGSVCVLLIIYFIKKIKTKVQK